MELILTRFYQDEQVTFGFIKELSIFTLENPWKDNQRNVSCIPAGVYECEPFSGSKYKNVYQVMNVPNRNYILFHVGNYEHQTEGCILVGSGVDLPSKMITNSTIAMNKLRETIKGNSFDLIIP